MKSSEAAAGAALIQKARALLVASTVLWGLSFPLMRGLELAQKEHTPNGPDAAMACANMAVRFTLAALVMLPIYFKDLARITGREWNQAIGLGLLGGVGLYLQTLGLAWTDASVSAFLTQLYALLVPLIVALRDRSWPSLRVMIACVMVLLGVAMLSPGLLDHFALGPGAMVLIGGAIFVAGQIVWVERPIYAENRAGLVTMLMFAIMGGMFIVAYAGTSAPSGFAIQLFNTPVLGTLTLTMVLFCTVVNYLIMNTWQRCVSATEAGLIYCLEPVIATLFSAFLPGLISHLAGITYPNELLSWTLLAGGALILSATVLVATQKRTVL